MRRRRITRTLAVPAMALWSWSALWVADARGQDPADTGVEARRAAAVETIHALRAELGEVARPPFSEPRARAYCDDDPFAVAERFGRDCAIEAGKIVPSLLRLAAAGLASGLGPRRDGERPEDPTIEDVANAVGIPVSAVSCLVKGVVRATYGEDPTTEDLIVQIDGATDLYQLAGLLHAAGGGARALANRELTGLGDELARALESDPAGTTDTLLGPTQTQGWLDRIAAAWDRTLIAQWSAASDAAEAARERFESCDVDRALEIQATVADKVRSWSRGWYQWLDLMERGFYCAEVGWRASVGLNSRYRSELESQTEQYRRGLDDVRDLLHPPWAEPGSLEARRRDTERIEAGLRLLDQTVAEARESCDVRPALTALRAIDATGACFDFLAGPGGAARLRARQQELQALQLARRDLAPTLGPAAREAENRIATCDLGSWEEPLAQARAAFDRRHAPGYPLDSMRSCWDGDWPLRVLAERARAREAELSAASLAAREQAEAAAAFVERCAWTEAESALAAAQGQLAAAACPLRDDACDGASYDPVLCSLVLVRDRVEETSTVLAERRDAVQRQAEETIRVGTELTRWAGEVEARLAERGTRCLALQDAAGIVRDLDALTAPPGCPAASLPELEDLRRRARELERAADAALQREQEELSAARDAAARAAEACEPDALANAIAELEGMSASLCRAPAPDLAALRRRQAEIERQIADAGTVLREAEQALEAWHASCDPVPLRTQEARISNLESCGWDQLNADQRARASSLMAWGERAEQLAALHERHRELERALLDARLRIEAAEQRIPYGGAETPVQRREIDELRRSARQALDRARSELAALEGDPWTGRACLGGADELADLEARLAGIGRAVAERAEESAPGATDERTSDPAAGWGAGQAEIREGGAEGRASTDAFCAGLESALGLGRSALERGDLETWSTTALPMLRKGCRDPRLIDQLAGAARLEEALGRDRDQRIAGRVAQDAARQRQREARRRETWAGVAGTLAGVLEEVQRSRTQVPPGTGEPLPPSSPPAPGAGGVAAPGSSASGRGSGACYVEAHPGSDRPEVHWWVLAVPVARTIYVQPFDPEWTPEERAKHLAAQQPPHARVYERGRYPTKSAAIAAAERLRPEICP